MNWNVYVEYAARVSDDVHDTTAELLADYAAVPGDAPNGNFSVYLSVQAPTVEKAITEALAACDNVVQRAHGRAAVAGVEVMTEAERDRRNYEQPLVPEIAGRAEVAKILGVSPDRAGQILRTKRFQEHAPIVGELASGPVFLAAQVRHFAEVWETLPGPKPAATKATRAKERQIA